MDWQELIASRPDLAGFWALVCATAGSIATLIVRGLLQVYVVIRRRNEAGHREGVVRLSIGRESSDKIPKSGEYPIVEPNKK